MLPAKFPTPAKVSYSSSKKVGPSIIVLGFYASGDLIAIHHAYSKALKAAGYTITHEEQDAADSEVVWKGHGKTGQVVGNVVSEWSQILSLVWFTKYLVEKGSRENGRE